jgi:putative ABC transport system permease protein
VHTLLQDLRFAVRTLRRGILVTLLAVLSLSLAIGGNATVFSLINGFLYRPLPYPEADRIVLLGERETDQARGTNALVSSLAVYADLEDRTQTLAELAAFRPATYSLSGGERPVPVTGARVTPSFFPLLGTAAQRGRVFREDEGHEGAARIAVVTREYQDRTWGEEVDPLEQVMVLNGEPHQVVGVLPAGWEFLTPGLDVWTPLRVNPRETPRDRRDAFILARMATGIGMEAVYAESEAIAGEIAAEFPATNRGWTIDAFNLRHDIPTDQSRTLLAMLQGSVLFVLLIACANITNLLLAQGQERQREIALRTVLGAGRQRIVRQLLTESLLLVSIGGAIGLALGFVGIRLLTNAFGGQLPAAYAPVMDLNVLAFTLGVTVFAGDSSWPRSPCPWWHWRAGASSFRASSS